MLISDKWKSKAKDIVQMVWGEKIPEASIDAYLNRVVEQQRKQFPILQMRNIYTNQGLEIPLDNILNVVKEQDLCITGNNTLLYSYRKVQSPIPQILIDLYANRSSHKKRAKEYSEKMTRMRHEGINAGDPQYVELDILWSVEDSLEKAIKILMNSIYGVQGLNGSIIFSPDTAGAVTSQGQALISEMMWSIERLLYGTIYFSTFSEFFSFLDEIIKGVDYASSLLEYITYRPTQAEVQTRLIELLHNIPRLYDEVSDVEISLFHFISHLDEVQRIYVYYKCDFLKLVFQNPKILTIIYSLLVDPAPYNSTSEKDTPPHFIPSLELLGQLTETFVMVKMLTGNRIIKYQTRRRRGIIISDTDSIVINLQPFVKRFSEFYYYQQNLDTGDCEHLAFNNEALCFKIVNIMSYLCTYVTKITAKFFCEASNVPEELRNWIAMKNEFYFKRLVMYVNAKKNYICHVKLNEGKIQDEVTATGIKFNSIVSNALVHDKIMDTIEHKILKSKEVNPVAVLRDIKSLEHEIIHRIMEGDVTCGKKSRYSGPQGYKTTKRKKKPGEEKSLLPKEVVPGLYTNSIGRSCYIWNLLYPSSPINIGDYAYLFDTTIEDKEDLKRLQYTFPEEYELIKRVVYENPKEPYLARYGLRSIAIPLTDTIKTIPPWLIDFIDYEGITNKNLQPIISLLPSIGIYKSRISSAKSTYSPLIAF
jgi:hypothetical protein